MWFDVPDYKGRYQVTKEGNIRTLNWRGSKGDVRELRCVRDKKGYLTTAFTIGRNSRSVKLHRIIAITFIPNPLGLPQVNHLNGVKDDNRVENLEWCTNLDNSKHAWANGFFKSRKGRLNANAKLTEQEVGLIRKAYVPGIVRQVDIAKQFGITQVCVSQIISGKRWESL